MTMRVCNHKSSNSCCHRITANYHKCRPFLRRYNSIDSNNNNYSKNNNSFFIEIRKTQTVNFRSRSVCSSQVNNNNNNNNKLVIDTNSNEINNLSNNNNNNCNDKSTTIIVNNDKNIIDSSDINNNDNTKAINKNNYNDHNNNNSNSNYINKESPLNRVQLLSSIFRFSIPLLSIPISDPLMTLIDIICIGQINNNNSNNNVELAALAPGSLVFNFIHYGLYSIR